MSDTDSLIATVHTANARVHDDCAALHDRHVPYISRPNTRAYYWTLLREACQAHGSGFRGSRVLEIGCGTGTFTDLVMQAGASSFEGIDVSPKMIELARVKALDAVGPNRSVAYHVASLEGFACANPSRFD